MVDAAFQSDENLTNNGKWSPSLLDLPTELILHIIKLLPQSPYYKCLTVCKRLHAIENQHTVERITMCICRVREYSPNLPSDELKLLICTNASSHQLETFVKIIKRQCPTCTTTITGERLNVEHLKNYLEKLVDHPNVKVFLENSETNMINYNNASCKSINLRYNTDNELTKRCIESYIEVTLGDDQDLIKRFANLIQTSCFRSIVINCTNINLQLFIHSLTNYCHIFDVIDFQENAAYMKIDYVSSTPTHVDLLNNFHNLVELTLTIEEVDLEKLQNRILELIHVFKQVKFHRLYKLRLFDESTFGYVKDLIPEWADLLAAIASNDITKIDVRSIKGQNQLTTQFESPYSLSMAHSIEHCKRLECLTIYHFGFDRTLIRILPSLCQLRTLDLRINMDMSDENVINELCRNLEKCNKLEAITMYVPPTAPMMFRNVFISLAKLQSFHEIRLHFDSFKVLPADECFEKLRLINNLRYVYLCIKRRYFRGADNFHGICDRLKKIIERCVRQDCHVDSRFCDKWH